MVEAALQPQTPTDIRLPLITAVSCEVENLSCFTCTGAWAALKKSQKYLWTENRDGGLCFQQEQKTDWPVKAAVDGYKNLLILYVNIGS